MKTLLIGVYSGTGYFADWEACTALFESPYDDAETLKSKIRELALAYLRKEKASGWKMPYDYNFGDIIELCEEPEFAEILKAEGIELLPFGEELLVDALEHDDIWVSEDDVNV